MERLCWPPAKIIRTAPNSEGKLVPTWRLCSVHGLEFPMPLTCPACDRELLYKIQQGEVRVVALEENEEWPEMMFEGKRMTWSTTKKETGENNNNVHQSEDGDK